LFWFRVSAKINGITPDNLPRDLKGQLEGLVHSNPNRMEGYIRAGCVHLTVKFTLTKDQANAVQVRIPSCFRADPMPRPAKLHEEDAVMWNVYDVPPYVF
jgi:hypothetical protein